MMSARTLSIFAIAMINVAAIGTVKNWPVAAVYGFTALFYLVLSAVLFFIPVSLVSAELATGWPRLGGIFVWVKEAFGQRLGFLAIWLLWVENVFWYPIALSFVTSAVAYIINPDLSSHKIYTTVLMLAFFWATTLANFRGMRISSLISTFSVVFGVFIPAALIIILGFSWFFSGQPLQIDFSLKTLIPDITSPDQMAILIGVLFLFAGIEMSAVHALDVKNPQRDFPKAILLSVVIIVGLAILGVLSIAIVIPQEKISLVAGSLQAFSYFVDAYNLKWLTPYIAGLMAIGAIGSMSTWIVGPSKGLLAAAQSGDLPPCFRKVNKHGMPAPLLVAQAVIVSLLSLLFVCMPSINSAFFIITVIVSQLYLLMYILMFAAAIKLRYSKPDVERAYKIPGGKLGMWIVGGTGIATCLFGVIIGFFPPEQIPTGNFTFYLGFLILGMIVTCAAPSIFLAFKKPHWDTLLAHEGKEQ